MKSVLKNLTGIQINNSIFVVVSGISKIYVGELVENAKEYMEKLGEDGPIQPHHLRYIFLFLNFQREGHRRLKKKQNSYDRTRQRDGPTTFILCVNYNELKTPASTHPESVKVPVHRNYDCG